ncbi:MAG: carboxypeptidase regulatory-like domain-containing protein [Chitinophagaceae bacterium]|nr:carboxypeptidase regulatory-like domain-containing protein [Chitinophagaceae bacterium]
MKRLFYPVLLICISILSFNCQKEISGEGGGPSLPAPSAPITATIQGKIVDENNLPAAGVSIKVGTKTAITDAKGYFRITKASLDKNASLVVAEKSGYFKAYRTFQATSGANHVSIKLIKKVLAGTTSSATGGDVILPNGSKISLPANGIVKAFGGSYSGTVNVYSAYIDPTAADISQTVPGSFMADDKDGKRVTLTSYGMLAVELESPAGEKLQIAIDKKATLTAPIPSSILASAPATIPLWYVDEQTGIWKEEGTAVKNGNNYVGDVKHFSFWNYDICVPAINLSMTLKNPDGIPLVHVQVRLKRSNGSSSYGYTDTLGRVSGLVPANEILQMDVMNNCNASVYNQNIGPFTQNTDLGVITITAPVSAQLTIQGTVLNCSGNPVTNGTVVVDYDYPRYVNTNASGQFAVVIYGCGGGGPSTCSITATDNTAQQQGNIVVVPITTPVTYAGNITACGTSTAQFINYTLDGTPYALASPQDSMICYTVGQANPYFTILSGNGNPSNNNIDIWTQHPTVTAGTYPLWMLQVQNYTRIQLLTPADISFTTFPSPGGFYEGNFSVNFKDSSDLSVSHTLNGNFRIKRY